MTQSANEQAQFSQEEVREAESLEQAALSASQNAYLTRRVVVLRAQLNRLQNEVATLTAALAAQEQAPEDEEKEEPASD